MFLLLAGPRTAEVDGELELIAGRLRGGTGGPRVWRDHDRNAGAASVAPGFVPEDAFDQQPLFADDRLFVGQARIDNRDDLLRRLGRAPDAPMADSALLAAAYARWGEACVAEVTGDFAFAVWHRSDGRVVAAVDHLGARRLLWARVGSGIALSPQLPPLLAHPQVSKEPDLASLARLFDFGIDRASTPFCGVRAVPGGHLLTWRPGGEPLTERWWCPISRPIVWHDDPDDYVAETRELLQRAVTAQLRSSTPISSTLSGGLDSGCVTGTAARLQAGLGARLTAYTAVPEPGLAASQRPGWEADDRPYAEQVVSMHPNIDHRLVSPSGRCVLDLLESIHERAVTPTKSATNLLWLDGVSNSAAAAKSHVLLVGQHGNAAFSWRGDAQIWELARLGRHRAALAQVRLEAVTRETNAPRVVAGALRAGLRASSRRRTIGDGMRAPGLDFINEDRRSPSPARGGTYGHAPGSRAAWAGFATAAKHVWWPDPVAQWGVEWRDPTADRRLIERLLQYPQSAFRIDGRPRGLARRVGEGVIPEPVRLRSTQGAQVPEAPSLIAAHASRYEAALVAMRATPACRELFDLATLRGALQALKHGATDYYLALAVDRAFDVGLFLTRLEHPT